MHIDEEIRRITEKLGHPPNNLEQYDTFKSIIIDLKVSINENFGYIPTIKECVYLIRNNSTHPHKCRGIDCCNIAKFGRNSYNYCSRMCSDTDVARNGKIQSKRTLAKIDYVAVHKKAVKTKSDNIIDGMNTHQRSTIKAINTRNIPEKYDMWRENHMLGIAGKSETTYKNAYKKKCITMLQKYGVVHSGGGYSVLKCGKINDKIFVYQGYEDIALYDLIEVRKISVDDIQDCCRHTEHKFSYIGIDGKQKTYYPDLYIQSLNLYIEVKSQYWNDRDLNILQKKQAIIDSGFNYEKILYGDSKYVNRIRRILKERDFYTTE